MTLQELREKRTAILAKYDESPNAESAAALLDEAEVLTGEIRNLERREVLNAALSQPLPRKSTPVAAPVVKVENALDRFFAALPRGTNAVQNAAGDMFREAQDADGGYLLPVDKRQLVNLLTPASLVHGRCDLIYTPSNAVTVPVDFDPDWSSDLAAADVAEGAELTEDKVALGSVTATLAKSGVLVRVTREMLEDNSGIAEYITTKLGRKLAWKLHAKAVAAFLASAGGITSAKTAGAPAGSAPDLANIQKMFASMLVSNRTNAVWLANPALQTVLMNLKVEGAAGGVFPIYLPANGLAGNPSDRLLGLPIVYVDGLPAVGVQGDLMLVDPSTFWGVLKTQGPRIDSSVEAEFKADTVLYRGYIRSVFVSKWPSTVTRPDGTTAGNVITLATRA